MAEILAIWATCTKIKISHSYLERKAETPGTFSFHNHMGFPPLFLFSGNCLDDINLKICCTWHDSAAGTTLRSYFITVMILVCQSPQISRFRCHCLQITASFLPGRLSTYCGLFSTAAPQHSWDVGPLLTCGVF